MNFALRCISGASLGVSFMMMAVANCLVAADSLQAIHRIRHGGQMREFEVAKDELVVSGSEASSVRIARLPSAEAIRNHAEQQQRLSGREASLVLYERGVPRTEFTRKVLARQVLVQVTAGADIQELARQAGAARFIVVNGRPGWFLMESKAVDGALTMAGRLAGRVGVLFAEPQLASRKQTKTLPNDPYFLQQWHLRNVGQGGALPGIDIQVTNVWDIWRGAGVIVGIVDDGLQLAHPDLAPNVSAGLHWDFNDNDADPSPSGNDAHGTSVGGIVGARGNNGIGVAGVAYEATLVGLRLLGGVTTDEQEAAALLHSNAVIQIKNNSWGPADGAAVLEGPGPLTAAALADGAALGRQGRGTIYVWAGGNGRESGENVNYDGYANSIHVFPIAALGDSGLQADYSEPGSCLVVTAPSLGSYFADCDAPQGITTTDLMGNRGENYSGAWCELPDPNYTKQFSGTSAATPVVSGVIALMLQANPGLGYRDVKEILLRSARQVDASDADWATNAAGIRHNHKYGAGLVDAEMAVSLATNWANLGPRQTLAFEQTGLAMTVPDNDPAGIVRTFTITNENFRVEHATLAVTLPHTHHGDLAITLVSPSGTRSRLAEQHSSGGTGYYGWVFSTVRAWGEHARGTWTVEIADLVSTNTGTLNGLVLSLYGSMPQATLAVGVTNDTRLVTVRSAAPTWKYVVESSTNCVNWTTVGLLEMGMSGRATYADTEANSLRFYRARMAQKKAMRPSPLR